jgi:3'-5' exoribonuclease
MNGNPPLFDTHISVKDLKAGDVVLQFFELKSKEVRKTRSGQDYLDLAVGDATGSLAAKVWSDALRKWGQDFDPGDFVKIEGRIEIYKDRNQMIVEKIRKVDNSEVPDPAILVRSTEADTDALFEDLKETAASLQPPELSRLLAHILDSNEEALKTYPAAKMIHHAYKGGLIEHIAAVKEKVEAILRLEEKIDRNIAIAGAILHDIGKVRELAQSGSSRTLEGRLIGHVILGTDILLDAARETGVDPSAPWLCEIEHIMLSHHGETQFGAPVKPLTREAILVHFIDNLDSKLKIIDEALESIDSEGFTSYNKWLEGRLYAGSHTLQEEE